MLTIFIWFVQTFVCGSGKCYAFLSNALSGGKQRFASRKALLLTGRGLRTGKCANVCHDMLYHLLKKRLCRITIKSIFASEIDI